MIIFFAPLGSFLHVRITKYARVSTTHCQCICTHCSNPKPNPPPLLIYLLYSLHWEARFLRLVGKELHGTSPYRRVLNHFPVLECHVQQSCVSDNCTAMQVHIWSGPHCGVQHIACILLQPIPVYWRISYSLALRFVSKRSKGARAAKPSPQLSKDALPSEQP